MLHLLPSFGDSSFDPHGSIIGCYELHDGREFGLAVLCYRLFRFINIVKSLSFSSSVLCDVPFPIIILMMK